MTVTECITIAIRMHTNFVDIHVPVIRSDDELSLGSIQVTSKGLFAKCVLVVIGDGEDVTNVT